MNEMRIVLIIFGAVCLIIARLAEPLYDFGTGFLRKMHLERIADMRERLKEGALRVARILLVLMAIGSIAAVFFLPSQR